MTKVVLSLIFAALTLSAQQTSLFQVADQNGKKVLDVTNEGLIILNPQGGGYDDTLMIITNSQIKTFVDGNPGKGLARSYSVASSTTQKGTQSSLLNFSKDNLFLGLTAGSNINQGKYNVFIGNESGKLTTGPIPDMFMPGFLNTFVGHQSGMGATNSESNTYIGAFSGTLNADGDNNTFVGSNSGSKNTGYSNTFVGSYACGYNAGNGYYNTFLGNLAGSTNTTGYKNLFLGRSAGEANATGYNNVYIGEYTGGANISGFGNVFLGNRAGSAETGSNRLYIDNSNTTSPLIYGDFANNRVVINGNGTNNINNRTFFVNGSAGGTGAWWNDSDLRLKKNIATIPDALNKVNKLRGVNFDWIDGGMHEKGRQMGFIAQEAEKIIPEVVSSENNHYSMQYASVTAILVEAVKELSSQNKSQSARFDKIEQENKELKEAIEKIRLKLNLK